MPKSLRVGPFFGVTGRYSAAPNRQFLDENYIREGLFFSTYAASLARTDIVTNTVAGVPTNGDIKAAIVPLQEGMVITSLTAGIGSTAAGTPTAGFMALYDTAPTPNLMEQTPNSTTGAIAASTLYTRALNRPIQIPITGAYYLAFSVTATTVNTFSGVNLANSAVSTGLAGQAMQCGTVTGTFGGAAPATLTGLTAIGSIPYFACT